MPYKSTFMVTVTTEKPTEFHSLGDIAYAAEGGAQLTMEQKLANDPVRPLTVADLYHVPEPQQVRYWGVYRKSKRRLFGLFRLVHIAISRDEAIKEALRRAEAERGYYFSIQVDNDVLSLAYDP